MSKGARVAAVLVSFAIGISLILFGIFGYLRSRPPTVAATPSSTHPGSVNLVLQTDGAVGVGPHPNWVGYWAQDAAGKWKQTTLLQVPAHTKVNVTVYEYDSGGALRNPLWGKIQGTTGGTVNINGKTVSLVNPNKGNGIAHTFAVPSLGIVVPFYGVSGKEKNFCTTGPCNLSEAHVTTKFSFTTGNTGTFRWQCFIPCGLGYLMGNGGPMTTVGYMAGFLKVVNA